MAFPKADLKRFNDITGCAPPVGTYDPKDTPSKGGIALDKTDRFKEAKDVTPGPGNTTFDAGVTKSRSSTPMKQNLSRASSNESLKMKKPAVPDENAFKIRALEKEIKKLLLEQTERERQLQHKEEELQKLEGKLHSVQSDRSTLQSRLAALERDNKDLTKGNDILKNRLKTSEAALKKREDKLDSDLHELKRKLDAKDKDAARERTELEETLKKKEEKLDCDLQELQKKLDLKDKERTELEEALRKKEERLTAELEDMKEQLERKAEEAAREKEEVEVSVAALVVEMQGLESLTVTLEETAAVIKRKDSYADEKACKEVRRSSSQTSKKVAEMLENNVGAGERPAKEVLAVIKESLKQVGGEVSQWAVELGEQLVAWETAMQERVSQAQEQALDLQTLLSKSQENMESNLACSQALRQYRESLETENAQLKELVKEMKLAEHDYLETIRSLKGEMFVLEDEKRTEEQLAFEANAETAMLMEEVEQEEEHKVEIMSSLRALTDKYHALEAALLTEQEEKVEVKHRLQAQAERLKSRLEAADREHQLLQQTNSRLVADSQHDKVEIDKLTQEARELGARLDDLSAENAELAGQLEASKGQATVAKTQAESRAVVIQLMQKQLTATREESDRLRDVVTLQTQRAETLEQQLASVQGNETVVSQRLSELTASHRQVVETYQEQVAGLEAEKRDLIEEKHGLEDSLASMAAAKSALDTQLQELQAEAEEREKAAARALEEKEEEVSSVKQQLEEEREQHKTEMSQRASQLLNVQARLGEAQRSQAHALLLHQATAEQLELQLAEASYQGALTQQALLDAQEKHQLRLLEEAEKAASLTEQLQEKEGDMASLAEKLGEVEERMADLQKRHECDVLDRDEQIVALKEKLHAVEFSLEKFSAEMEALCKEKDEELAVWVDRVAREERAAQELKHEVDRHEKHIDSLEEQAASDKASLKKQEAEMAKKDELIAELEVKITSVVAAEQELQAKLITLVEENTKHTEQHELEMKSVRSSMEEQREKFEEERKSMGETRNQLEEGIRQKEEEVTRLEECLANLREEFSSVETSRKAFEKQLKTELDREEEEKARTDEKLRASETALEELREKLRAAESDIQELESRYEQDVAMKDVEVTQLQATVSTLEMALENEAAQHQAELAEKRDKLDLLNAHVEVTESTARRWKEQCQDKAKEVEALSAKLKASEDWYLNDAKAKDARLRNLSQQLEELRREMEEARKKAVTADTLSQALSAKAAQVAKLQKELEKLTDVKERLAKAETELMAKQLELMSTKETCASLEAELEQSERQHQAREEEIQELQNQLAELSHEEAEKWRMMYEELQAKVAPFIEQLDAFELERQALLGRSQFAQSEMDKLSREYARVLGHQNQKQKIKHIIKIKEENNNLKKEVTDLREQCAKQKRSLQRLEERQAAAEGKRRFDPKKAFTTTKENAPTPLKDGNRQ